MLRFLYHIHTSTTASATSATTAERGDYSSGNNNSRQHDDVVMETSGNGSGDCRVALLYSGHVRSFAHPRVHHTHLQNLIHPLEEECDVGVFMYLAGNIVILQFEPRLFGAHVTHPIPRNSVAIVRRGVDTFRTRFFPSAIVQLY